MNRSARLVLSLFTVGLIAASSAETRADDWSGAGFDALHQRVSPERVGNRFEPGWSLTLSSAYAISSPALADGILVMGARDGIVRGFAASTGRLLWQFPTSDTVQASPAIHNGRVFVSSLDGKLYALHLADGTLAWERDLGGLEYASPTVVGDSLLIPHGFPGRSLLKLDTKTGDTLWETTPEILTQFSNSSPVSDGAQVFVAVNEGQLASFDFATGNHLWTYEAEGIVNAASPLLANGRVYLFPGGSSGKVHAVDIATGKSVPGWPVDVPAANLDVTGALVHREFAMSSLAMIGDRLMFDMRLDDAVDTDGDGAADQYLLRESIVAMSASDGQLLWQRDNGRKLIASANDLPSFWLCPTPVVFQALGSPSGTSSLFAVTSTLQPTLRVLNGRTGGDLWSTQLPGVSRLSPIVANGRLFAATDVGSLGSFRSTGNHPPDVPSLVGGTVRDVNNVAPVVEWGDALDPEADAVSYEVRMDRDGEILETWEATTTTGETSWHVPSPLPTGVTTMVAVRARDSNGAWSDWSAPQFLMAIETPSVTVGGQPSASLAAALGAAMPGDVISIGAGRSVLGQPLHLKGGVTLEGAGAGRTKLDATGQKTGIVVEGTAAGQPAAVKHLTVSGAHVGISVADSKDVRVTNVVLVDNSEIGLDVGAAGSATLRNGTLVGNGTGARSFGALLVKNSVVVSNQVGLVASQPDALVSQFDDVVGNSVADYQGLAAATADLSSPVTFLDLAKRDLHLVPAQASTDHGDPADDFAAEPSPNGGRINLGAFGGTAEAELSAPPAATTPTDGTADGGSGGDSGAGGTSPDGGAPPGDPPVSPPPISPISPSPASPPPAAGPPSPAAPGASSAGSSGGGCDIGGNGGSGPPAAALPVLALAVLAMRRRKRSQRTRVTIAASNSHAPSRTRRRVGFPIAGTAGLALWLIAGSASANTCTWHQTSGNNFGTSANWNTCGGTAPGAADAAVFNSTSSSACTIAAGVVVGSISINSGYGGTITQASAQYLITLGAFTQAAGTFAGGDNYIGVNGDFTLSGGTFTSTSNVLQLYGAFNATGGTFNHHSGEVLLTSTSSKTFASNSVTFNDLVINDGLIGYWQMDESTGSSALDSSGYGYNATGYYASNPPTASTTIPSLSFRNPHSKAFAAVAGNNTTTQYLAVTYMPGTLQPTVVTMSAWYRSTGGLGANGGEVISGSNRYAVRIFNGTTIKVAKQWASANWTELSGPVSNALDGNWHHIAGVLNGSGMIAYFDGVQVASNTDTHAIFYGTSVNTAVNSGAVGYLNFARNQDTTGYEFNGNIDEARVYNRTLSATEIAALAAGTIPASSAATESLTGSPTVAGDLVVASGTLAAGSNTITVGGNFWNYGGVFTSSAGLTFNGSSAGNYILGGTGSSFQNVTISGTGSWSVADSTQVTLGGNLNISSGTFTSTSGLLLIQGAFNKTGGTFTHNSGQVMLGSTTNQTFATNSTTFYDLTINDGLIGYWKLDETASPSADASGYGFDATWGSTPASSTTVPIGVDFADSHSLNFDSASDTASFSTPNATVISVSAWVKATAAGGGAYQRILETPGYAVFICGAGLTAPDNPMSLGFSSVRTTTSGDYRSPSNSMSYGSWYHVAITYDSSSTSNTPLFYINGVLQATTVKSAAAGTAWPNVGTGYIGNRAGLDRYFNGLIDDLRIYNRALSATEVMSLAIGGQPGTSVATQSMTGAPTIAGDLTIASGELAVSTNNLTVVGNWLNYGGLFTPGVQTVTLSGSGSTVIRTSGQLFSNLTLSGAGTVTLNDRLETDPTATVSVPAGTVNLSSYTLRTGNFTGGGTITPSTSTVVLDGTSSHTFTAASYNNLRIEPVGATNLVGYWKLDEGQGLTTDDYSGNGMTATLTNGPVWSESSLPGAIAFEDPAALTFDRTSSQYLVTGTLPTALKPSVVTMSAWYKATSVGTNGSEIVSGSNRYTLRLFSSTQVQVVKQTSSSTWVALTANVTNPLDGNWHHLAGVIASTGMTAYFDGASVASNADGTAIYYAGATGLNMGRNGASANYGFTGTMDDVRVYNTALTDAQINSLAIGTNPAGLAGTPTYTLGASTTVSGALSVDNGTLDTGTGYTMNASSASNVATVYSGGYTVGNSASTMAGGLTVKNDGTLTMATSSGALKIGSTKTLNIDGTLNASSTGATIQTAGSAGTTYTFTVGGTATAAPTLNITGLAVKNTTANGLYINSWAGGGGSTTNYTYTTFTHFNNIAFSTGTSGASNRLLRIYAPTLYLVSNGCTFDASTGKNVTLKGDGNATETRAIFGGATCANSPCESYDDDDDSTADGIGDNTGSNAAVIQWTNAAMDDTDGTIEGFPIAAFDWNSFTYYASYVSYHDVGGTTADRVYVRSSTGAAKYSWDAPLNEDVIGAPRFDSVTVSMVTTRYVFVATTAGHVYRLIDNGTTLTTDWTYNCSCTINTPLTLDATNLYFGGTTGGTTAQYWNLSQSTGLVANGSYPFSLGTSVTLSSAAPALTTISSVNYLFGGLSGHFYKFNMTAAGLTTDNSSPSGVVNGRLSIFTGKVYGMDNAGKLWVLDATNFSNTALWTYQYTAHSGGCAAASVCGVTGGPYVDPPTGRAYYGDSDGHLYGAYNSTGITGALVWAAPFSTGNTSDVFSSAPLYKGGYLIAGSTIGNLYVLNVTGPSLVQTYKFGTNTRISGVAYDSGTNSYLVSTANPTNKDGNLFYLPAY